MATFALAVPARADDDREATMAEKQQVSDALTKDGYTMVDDIHVDNDQFEADAKSKDGKDVEVTVDMKTLKVLKVRPN
jgi:uncharacterized membrane protein YkoI